MYAQLTIPKLSNTYKLYVYCSKNPESINTISKVRALQPTLIIDEAVAQTKSVNGKDCYVVPDKQDVNLPGVTWNGPKLTILPTTEYETEVGVVKINDYTYVNTLSLHELITPVQGVMLYYSVIGIDDSQTINGGNPITHLSKVAGTLMRIPFKDNGARHIYSCDNNTDSGDDVWTYIGSCAWDEEISIGDLSDISNFDRFGNPFVETVPIFKNEDISVDKRPLSSNDFVVLEVPNPWQKNNQTYNFRKLKSFKVQNVSDEQYSDFSMPTFQSLLPVSIEKMIILEMKDAENPNSPIPIPYTTAAENENFHVYEVVRKDGIYYNVLKHKSLGFNKFNIPIEDTRFPTYAIIDGEVVEVPPVPQEVIPLIPTIGGGLIVGDPEELPPIVSDEPEELNAGDIPPVGPDTSDGPEEPEEPEEPQPTLPRQIEKVIGVFSEGSVQDTIRIQLEAHPAHNYKYTIYLLDVYGNVSDPAFLFVEM